jgi:hypothetical protein
VRIWQDLAKGICVSDQCLHFCLVTIPKSNKMHPTLAKQGHRKWKEIHVCETLVCCLWNSSVHLKYWTEASSEILLVLLGSLWFIMIRVGTGIKLVGWQCPWTLEKKREQKEWCGVSSTQQTHLEFLPHKTPLKLGRNLSILDGQTTSVFPTCNHYGAQSSTTFAPRVSDLKFDSRWGLGQNYAKK